MTGPAARSSTSVDDELERAAASFLDPDKMFRIVHDPDADQRDLWTAARVWRNSGEAELVPWIVTHPAADQAMIDYTLDPDVLDGLPADLLVPIAMCPIQFSDEVRTLFTGHPAPEVRAAFERYGATHDRPNP
ncbi:MAG: hypothetical protein R2726_06780 [Acidimicrobiales bacterium]